MTSRFVPRLVRLILAHATLVAGLPVLQRVGVLGGGWTDSVILVVTFMFLPLIAAWLVVRRQPRPGSILLLGPMISGVVLNLLLLQGLMVPPIAAHVWKILVPGWIVALMLVQAALSWVAFQVLREAHGPSIPPLDTPGR